VVRARAIERGLAKPGTVDRVIYGMDLHQFRELASDFPGLSRIYFQPGALNA
jgi:hypothetical protein